MTLVAERRPQDSPLPLHRVLTRAGEEPASPALPAPLLQVDGVSLEYRTAEHIVRATHRVGFDVYEADRFVLLGPSGCGKSTLLKAVAGFIAPVEGEIRLGGRPVSGPGPDRIVVFQEFDQLPPWKTVSQNVTFPLTASRALRAARLKSGRATMSRRSGSPSSPTAIRTSSPAA